MKRRSFPSLVRSEITKARAAYPKAMSSAHEAYAVILEEVDELWAEVKVKQAHHRHEAMLSELVQIAAMAQRMAEDVVMARMTERELPRARTAEGVFP